jgi:hypothetical protein
MSTLKKVEPSPTARAPTGAPGSLTSALFQMMGAPVVTSEEVQRWFEEAKVPAPPQKIATGIANKITGMGPTIALQREISKNPSPNDASIGNAIRTLRNELPKWLETKNVLRAARRVSPDLLPRLEEQLALFAKLRETIDLVVEREGMLLDYVLAGRRHAPWHGWAWYLRADLLDALKTCDVRRAGFGNATSPATKILKSALGWLGENVEEEAIVKAMRKLSRKGNKPA